MVSVLHLGLNFVILSRYRGLGFGWLMTSDLQQEASRYPHGWVVSSMLQWLLTMRPVVKYLV
jgi:hypothetical protein